MELDSVTKSSAFVRNGRMEVMAHNAHLDPDSANLFVGWEAAAVAALTRITHRHLSIPATGAPRQLVEELSTLSTQFRTHWVAHPVRIGRYGSKRLHTPTSATWT